MVLAAGLGTRLLPLTADRPKALIEVGGMTLLERTVSRLAHAGCDRIVVNVHHYAERISDAVAALECDSEIVISRERDRPLETGGGLKHARGLLRGDRPVLIHNVDVISGIDLGALLGDHRESGALATLAVHRRSSSRQLRFDERGLCGRRDRSTGVSEWSRVPRGTLREAAFTGIHVVAAELPGMLTEPGAFSIIRAYLRLAASGRRIGDRDVTGVEWSDVGTHDRLEAARTRWSS
jgi:NDP-sugar pyrophosphorylase family protein